MKKTHIALISLLFVSLLSTGCVSTRLAAVVSDNVDISTLKTFYVQKLPADDRGIEKVIAKELELLGYNATSGSEMDIPSGVDALVTYQDKWMWDITMYMIEINIQLRDPKTEVQLASGNSYRTSLVRKDPAFMVNEVLTEMFGK